jgi:hypothetical protein
MTKPAGGSFRTRLLRAIVDGTESDCSVSRGIKSETSCRNEKFLPMEIGYRFGETYPHKQIHGGI